jgi:hypothetical protein
MYSIKAWYLRRFTFFTLFILPRFRTITLFTKAKIKNTHEWAFIEIFIYSYIHVLHHLFPLKAIVFTVCEHEYMNVCPPPPPPNYRLSGAPALVQAGHESPRFWEITKFLHKGGGLSLFYRSSCRYQFDKVQSVCILTSACNFNE